MSHLGRIITSLLFITWLGSIVVCFTPTVRFGKNAVLKRIIEKWNISFKKCIDNCLARTRCNSLIYFPQLNKCKLGSNVIADSDISASSGRKIIVTGFEEYHKTAPVCGDRVCELTETCIEKEPGTHQCEVTECRRFKKAMIDEQKILGNFHTIGSKRKVDRLGVVATCSASGIWTIKKTGTERIITGASDCLSTASFTSDEVPFPQDNLNLVLCDVTTEGGNWVVFQRRFDGSENFYRDWNDYVNGFGELTGEFWLGLDKLSSIIADDNNGFELRIDMETFAGDRGYAKYSKFSISDASDMYRLSIGGYTGSNAGESLMWHDGMQFTTYDRDHDILHSANCAVGAQGAYWYRYCHASNLNGLYYNGDEGVANHASNPIWMSWSGFIPIKKTEMKIRKKS